MHPDESMGCIHHCVGVTIQDGHQYQMFGDDPFSHNTWYDLLPLTGVPKPFIFGIIFLILAFPYILDLYRACRWMAIGLWFSARRNG